MFKCTFMLEKIMKYICNKLGYEHHHILERVFKKKVIYIFVRTYLIAIYLKKKVALQK